MAAQAWTIYNEAKHRIGDGGIDLSGGAFRMSLFQSSSNFATATLSIIHELTNEVAEANGYSSSGKSLASVTWGSGASAGEQRWDAGDLIWTASGGTIPNIKAAVIWLSAAASAGRLLIAYASLTSSQFTLAQDNTLTISFSPNGIFELN